MRTTKFRFIGTSSFLYFVRDFFVFETITNHLRINRRCFSRTAKNNVFQKVADDNSGKKVGKCRKNVEKSAKKRRIKKFPVKNGEKQAAKITQRRDMNT